MSAQMADPANHTVKLDVSVGRDRSAPVPLPDDTFRIGLIGDFHGHRGSDTEDAAPLSARRAVQVDRDDIDEVLARFTPRLSLKLGDGTPVDLSFAELEHFHPDRLFERAPLFRALREARRRLLSPDTFQDALTSILGGPPEPHSDDNPPVGPNDVIADTLAGSVLEDVLGGEAGSDPMQDYLRRIVAPHVVPGEDPRREAMLADLDASVADAMRKVLHHPKFQAIESLWRSVFFMVRRLDTGPSLKLLLIDASVAELDSDSAIQQLARTLDQAFAVLVVDHAFGPSEGDLALLRRLAALAAERGCALLGGAGADLMGADTFTGLVEEGHVRQTDAWRTFRHTREAGAVGLVAPRYLVRQPYDTESNPCDSVRFEELDSPPVHDQYLWGSGAVTAAALLGQSFAASGWRMRPGQHVELSGLPIHTWREPDGPELQPCTEARMTDALVERILDAGPMPLAAVGHGDTLRLVRFQSVASPVRALRGPWLRTG